MFHVAVLCSALCFIQLWFPQIQIAVKPADGAGGKGGKGGMEQMPAYSVIPMPQQAMLMQQQAMMGGHPQMMQARMQMQQQPQPGRSATPSSSKIFIGGLPPSIDDAELERYFGQFGTLIDSIVMKTREGKPRGFGFVKYESSSSAREVQQLAAYCVYCTLGGAYCIAYS